MIGTILIPALFGAFQSVPAPSPQSLNSLVTGEYDPVVHLPPKQFVNELKYLSVDDSDSMEVVAVVRVANRDEVMSLNQGAFHSLVMPASSKEIGIPATELAPPPTPKEKGGCDFDWNDYISDPTDGDMHISSSLDGCTVLLLSLSEDIHAEGSVFVFRNAESAKSRQFVGLIQAVLSPDGKAVLVQSTEGLQIFSTKDFLGNGKSRTVPVTGQEQWNVGSVDSGNGPGLFLLNKELSVELYSTRPGQSSGTEKNGASLAAFRMETSSYAVNSQFDISTRLMIVAERRRVRVARLDENFHGTPLLDHKLPPGSSYEIRSCSLDRATALRDNDPRVRVAIGLRRNVVPASRTELGSCEVKFAVLLAGEAESSSVADHWGEHSTSSFSPPDKIAFSSDWESVERFAAGSPGLKFDLTGTKLYAMTRGRVWRCEVSQ